MSFRLRETVSIIKKKLTLNRFKKYDITDGSILTVYCLISFRLRETVSIIK